MNKHLRELAVKAQVEHCISHVRLEEFAELIIKECANELIKWKDEPFPYDPEFGARLIKQHFGVKE
jgi:hypothetical protein